MAVVVLVVVIVVMVAVVLGVVVLVMVVLVVKMVMVVMAVDFLKSRIVEASWQRRRKKCTGKESKQDKGFVNHARDKSRKKK